MFLKCFYQFIYPFTVINSIPISIPWIRCIKIYIFYLESILQNWQPQTQSCMKNATNHQIRYLKFPLYLLYIFKRLIHLMVFLQKKCSRILGKHVPGFLKDKSIIGYQMLDSLTRQVD